MLLVLVRHGESANNVRMHADSEATYSLNRDPDPPLTEAGFAGGLLCANYLKEAIAHVAAETGQAQRIRMVCSPFLRARQSADVLAGVIPDIQEIVLDPTVYEVGGLWSPARQITVAPPTSELLKPSRRPDLPPYNLTRMPAADGPWWDGPRETMSEATKRAQMVVTNLMTSFTESTDVLIVICHGLLLDLMWHALLPSPRRVGFVTHNWGVSVIKILPNDELTIQCINDASFIPVSHRVPHSVRHRHRTAF